MRFQISETIAFDDPEVILELLEMQLRSISRNVVRDEQTVRIRDIRISFASRMQTGTAVFFVRGNGADCLLTANVNYRPSFAFGFLFGSLIATALGWIIPLALYLSQEATIRRAIRDIILCVTAECEFNNFSFTEEAEQEPDV